MITTSIWAHVRKSIAALTVVVLGVGIFGNAAQAIADRLDRERQFEIPAQSLATALVQFSKQAEMQLVTSSTELGSRETRGISGQVSIRHALESLLDRTGLTYSLVGENTVAIVQEGTPRTKLADTVSAALEGPASIRLAQVENASNRDNTQREATSSDFPEEQETSTQRFQDRLAPEDLGEVVVTGTHIRGADVSSPVVTITPEEMRLSGHNNLGEALRALPQNFSGGQNPGVANGATTGASAGNTNITGASSLNLRGLGADATLTLLNGARLPYDGFNQATDVSIIPVAAIERIEILLDGASAIYGSDAVGGVANIVLKRDYDGAEFSARLGEATDGGFEQQQYTAIAGTNWGSGGFLVTGEVFRSEPIKARNRDYLDYMANQNVDIYPEQMHEGALVSGHQDIGAVAALNMDAFYTKRSQEALRQSSLSSLSILEGESSIWGVAPSLKVTLPGDWSVRLHGALGRNEAESTETRNSTATGALTFNSVTSYFNGMRAAGIEAEGPLFALPAGSARASIGGGYRRNSFDRETTNLITGAISNQIVGANESSRYVYGEVNLPLMTRLSLNAALRHENYDSFGASTTPKFGAIWEVIPGFDLKASWGRSFKVPTLAQQNQVNLLLLFPAASLGAVGAPLGSQVQLLSSGADSDLGPETAEILTAGFVATPEFLPGFRLEFSFFNIDYTDRVAFPIDQLSQTLSSPAYADFLVANPSIAQQDEAFAAAGLPVGTFSPGGNLAGAPYDPAQVIALVDNRSTNVSSQRVEGVDLIARYNTDLFDGDLSFTANGNWITEGTRKLRNNSPELPAAGVNFWPSRFKGRLGAGWSREGFALNASLNHIGGIIDRSVTPNIKRDSMTTCDLIVDYQWDSDLIGDVGINLAAMNVFNQEPPFLTPPVLPTFVVSYDSTNYSALGRAVSVTITKRF